MLEVNLGIVYKDGIPINHRSLLKITLNPILRMFGYCIASRIDNFFPILVKCNYRLSFVASLKASWVYKLEPEYKIVKRRTII